MEKFVLANNVLLQSLEHDLEELEELVTLKGLNFLVDAKMKTYMIRINNDAIKEKLDEDETGE